MRDLQAIAAYVFQLELVAQQHPPAPQLPKNLLSYTQDLSGQLFRAVSLLFIFNLWRGVLSYDKTSACAKSYGFGC